MHTIQSIKNKNKAAGYFFFSRDTMKFFASKIESPLMYGGDTYGYFVTSEKTGFESKKRHYKVRQANLISGDVSSIPSSKGESTYNNYPDALAKAKELTSIDAAEWLAAQIKAKNNEVIA